MRDMATLASRKTGVRCHRVQRFFKPCPSELQPELRSRLHFLILQNRVSGLFTQALYAAGRWRFRWCRSLKVTEGCVLVVVSRCASKGRFLVCGSDFL